MAALRIVIPAIVAVAASPALNAIAAAEPVMRQAQGSFEVAMKPLAEDKADGSTLGRLSLDKTYHGALEATAKGEMLTVVSEVPGSAAYVATERVIGTLDGKAGGFALVHRGVMRGQAQDLVIDIAPDSGVGALKGITGRLVITVVGGKHQYDLSYALPE